MLCPKEFPLNYADFYAMFSTASPFETLNCNSIFRRKISAILLSSFFLPPKWWSSRTTSRSHKASKSGDLLKISSRYLYSASLYSTDPNLVSKYDIAQANEFQFLRIISIIYYNNVSRQYRPFFFFTLAFKLLIPVVGC